MRILKKINWELQVACPALFIHQILHALPWPTGTCKHVLASLAWEAECYVDRSCNGAWPQILRIALTFGQIFGCCSSRRLWWRPRPWS